MRYLRSSGIGLVILALVAMGQASANAQVAEKKVLTLDGAMKAITAAIAEAKSKNAPGGVIAVVDDGGNLMAVQRLDGTFAAGANIAIGKARTSALFKKPTKVFEDIVNKGRTTMVALNDFTPLQGGVPIMLDGQVIGAIGASGAASAQQDEELAIAGANALKTIKASADGARSGEPVTYFDSQTVKAAFMKGSVLVDNGENMMHAARNYMVHASHRDAPGVAEIHELDADIVYVLEGTATLVTGGTAVEPKPIAPNEIRGKYIEGGETRRLVPGDVIIIPNQVPHWFKEVSSPFNYYVVKVR